MTAVAAEVGEALYLLVLGYAVLGLSYVAAEWTAERWHRWRHRNCSTWLDCPECLPKIIAAHDRTIILGAGAEYIPLSGQVSPPARPEPPPVRGSARPAHATYRDLRSKGHGKKPGAKIAAHRPPPLYDPCPCCGVLGTWSSRDPRAVYTPPPGHEVIRSRAGAARSWSVFRCPAQASARDVQHVRREHPPANAPACGHWLPGADGQAIAAPVLGCAECARHG